MLKHYFKTTSLIIIAFCLLFSLGIFFAVAKPADQSGQPKLKVLVIGKGDNPQDSFVVLEDLDKKEQGIYQLGDEAGGMKLEEISNEGAVFKKNNQERVSISKSQKDEDLLPELEKNIKKIGPNTWKIPKGEIIKATVNPNRYGTSFKVYGYLKDGKLSSIGITDIKKDSLPEKLGFKNNDIIKRVNGQKIETPKQAFKLYLDLMVKPKTTVKVDIERDQKEETLIYEIE